MPWYVTLAGLFAYFGSLVLFAWLWDLLERRKK